MIAFEAVHNFRSLGEKTSRRAALRLIRLDLKKDGSTHATAREALRSGDWWIKTWHYVFQPNRYYDTFGNGVYSPTYLDEKAKPYPKYETLDEAICFVQEHQIFGGVQRLAVLTGKDGKTTDVTAGIAYTTRGAPNTTLAVLTQIPKDTPDGGTNWEQSNPRFNLSDLLEAQEQEEVFDNALEVLS